MTSNNRSCGARVNPAPVSQPIISCLLLFFGLVLLATLVVWGVINLLFNHFVVCMLMLLSTRLAVNNVAQFFLAEVLVGLFSIALVVTVMSCSACSIGLPMFFGLLLAGFLAVGLSITTASIHGKIWDVDDYLAQHNSHIYTGYACVAVDLLFFALHIISIAPMCVILGISVLIVFCCGDDASVAANNMDYARMRLQGNLDHSLLLTAAEDVVALSVNQP